MSEREHDVAGADELKDGEMRQVSAGGVDVLVARVDGEHYALGAACTHYHAPLAEGLLSGDRIVCPWHHACFSVKTGDVLEPPALDALPRFACRVENGRVLVAVPEGAEDRRTPEMAKRGGDARTFAILGAGAAGYAAAQTLRECGFEGRV